MGNSNRQEFSAMTDFQARLQQITRRQLFRDCGVGLGKIALASLLVGANKASASPATINNPLAPRLPHFAAKAKRVIYLFMAGAPSQLDLFDNKPALVELSGKPIPKELVKNERFAFIRGEPKVLGSPYKFARHGKCGAELSELLPHLAEIVDDIA